MKMYIQYATRTPRDYTLVDSANWLQVPFKADPQLSAPVALNTLDNQNGYIVDLGVQGISFSADHYHVRNLTDGSGGIVVTIWSDNPTLNPPGKRQGQVWTILPLAPDSKFGGAMNTRQTRIVYAEQPDAYALWQSVMPIENTELRDWTLFTPPAASETRHGIWVTDTDWDRLVARRSEHGWREWLAP